MRHAKSRIGSGPLASLLIAIFLLFGGGLSTAVYASDVIKVGFIDSLTGPISSLGIPYDKGMKAAYAYKSSINGQEIEVIKLDDASSPSKAARNARKLINEDKVDIIIGTAGSPGTLAIAAVAREAKTPFISLAQASLPEDQDRTWLVNIPQPASLMFNVLAKYMKNEGVNTIGYIGFSDSWGDTAYKAIADDSKEFGMDVISDRRYARSDSSVTGQVLQTLTNQPDAVMTGTSGTPGALPYLELERRGYQGKIYGGHSLISSEFIKVGGDAVEGLVAPTGPVTVADQLPDDYPTRDMGVKFHEVYKQANGEPAADAFSSYSFDAWIVFLNAAENALKKAEPGSAEFRLALRNALNSTEEVVGAHAVYNFKPDEVYGVDDRAAVIVKLENGSWKLNESKVELDK